MIHDRKPEDWNATFSASTCFIVHKDKFLMLKCADHKTYPGCWQLPGGKSEDNESIKETVIREIQEETLINIHNPEFMSTWYISFPIVDFEFHLFKYSIKEDIEIIISKEHTDYKWVTFEEALALPLVLDGKELLLNVGKENIFS